MSELTREEELEEIIGCGQVATLRHYWMNETDDEEDQYWRDRLTPYEAELVDIWDDRYYSGIL